MKESVCPQIIEKDAISAIKSHYQEHHPTEKKKITNAQPHIIEEFFFKKQILPTHYKTKYEINNHIKHIIFDRTTYQISKQRYLHFGFIPSKLIPYDHSNTIHTEHLARYNKTDQTLTVYSEPHYDYFKSLAQSFPTLTSLYTITELIKCWEGATNE